MIRSKRSGLRKKGAFPRRNNGVRVGKNASSTSALFPNKYEIKQSIESELLATINRS